MKIALIINDDFSMYHFRGGLIRELVKKGIQVSVIVPLGNFNSKLEDLEARCIPVPMDRFISPIRDIFLIARLYKIFRDEKFDIVHNMTIKPNIYGTLAAKVAGIKRRVCLVSGGGFVFKDDLGLKMRLMQLPVTWLYRAALAISHKTWFQNPDDLESFVESEIIKREKAVLIRSGGINIEEYSPFSTNKEELKALRFELGIPSSANCVLMVTARLTWSKGVREFVEAASMLHGKYPNWYFVMVCPKDQGSPDSVPEEYLESQRLERLIVIDTFRHDIKNFVALADIMALPSFYPEGVPRTLLEGLAMAKPIVTTDNQGCRETVENGKNGYLIPIRNSDLLAEKLDILMADQNIRAQFGQESRRKAENEFSESSVVGRVIREIYELHSLKGTNSAR